VFPDAPGRGDIEAGVPLYDVAGSVCIDTISHLNLSIADRVSPNHAPITKDADAISESVYGIVLNRHVVRAIYCIDRINIMVIVRVDCIAANPCVDIGVCSKRDCVLVCRGIIRISDGVPGDVKILVSADGFDKDCGCPCHLVSHRRYRVVGYSNIGCKQTRAA